MIDTQGLKSALEAMQQMPKQRNNTQHINNNNPPGLKLFFHCIIQIMAGIIGTAICIQGNFGINKKLRNMDD